MSTARLKPNYDTAHVPKNPNRPGSEYRSAVIQMNEIDTMKKLNAESTESFAWLERISSESMLNT